MRRTAAILLFIGISLFSIFLSYRGSDSNPYLPIAISVCIELAFYYYANRIVNKTLLNFSTLFITLVFLFHFGQVLLVAFFPDVIEQYSFRIVIDYFSDTKACSALRLMNIAFCSLSLGTLFRFKSYRVPSQGLKKKIDIYALARYLIIFTFPIKIIIDFLTVYYSFTIGFSPTSQWLQAVPNFIRSFGNISMMGFGLLLVSLATNPRKQKRLFIFLLLYLAILMLSGWRSENVAYLAVFAYIYLSTRPKIKFKSFVLYAVVGYILLCFVQVVADMRTSSDRSLSGYSDMLSTMLFGGGLVLFDSIREIGNTGYTAECVLINWLNSFDPSWGKSYFLGLSAIFPNITGLAGRLTESAAFAIQLQEHNMVLNEYANIGGSVLGEFFFNFGVVGGIVFALIVGIVIGWVSNIVTSSLKTNQYYYLIFTIPVMFASLYWVRDSFGHLIRDVVWGIVLSLVLLHSMSNKRTTRGLVH